MLYFMANTTEALESDSMLDVHSRVKKVLKDNYVKLVSDLSGKEIVCFDAALGLSIVSGIFTASASILAFAAGFFDDRYLSFAAGCASIISMILHKASLYSQSQSQYQEDKLRNVLTSDYQFLNQYVTNPLSISIQPDPTMPDIDLDSVYDTELSKLKTKKIGNVRDNDQSKSKTKKGADFERITDELI